MSAFRRISKDWHDQQMKAGFYRPLRRCFIPFEERRAIARTIMSTIDELPAFRRHLIHIYGRHRARKLTEWHDRAAAKRLLYIAGKRCLPL